MLMNLHSSFFFRWGVPFLFSALTERPIIIFFSVQSPQVLRPTPASFSLRFIMGLSLELCSEFLIDYCFLWYYLRSTAFSFLRWWYSSRSLLWLLLCFLLKRIAYRSNWQLRSLDLWNLDSMAALISLYFCDSAGTLGVQSLALQEYLLLLAFEELLLEQLRVLSVYFLSFALKKLNDLSMFVSTKLL